MRFYGPVQLYFCYVGAEHYTFHVYPNRTAFQLFWLCWFCASYHLIGTVE